MSPKYKDTLFRAFFKQPQHFIHLLKHCNKNAHSLTVDDIIPFDLESEVAVRMRRNDVSFLTKDNRLIILVEHQSTINPNMAFRLFLYYSELLQLWIKTSGINIYSGAKITQFPIVEFYVAYNGQAKLKEQVSTFEIDNAHIKVAVTVNIIDIHFENLESQEADDTLAGYAYFYSQYDKLRQNGASGEEAFAQSRIKCIENGFLKGLIEKEEYVMFYKDIFDYDKQLLTEGMEAGMEKGIEAGLKSSMRIALKNNVPFNIVEKMAEEANMPREWIEEFFAEVG